MKKYRVGIIGMGWVAGAHLEAFKQIEQFEPHSILSTRKLDPAEFKRSTVSMLKFIMTLISSWPMKIWM